MFQSDQVPHRSANWPILAEVAFSTRRKCGTVGTSMHSSKHGLVCHISLVHINENSEELRNIRTWIRSSARKLYKRLLGCFLFGCNCQAQSSACCWLVHESSEDWSLLEVHEMSLASLFGLLRQPLQPSPTQSQELTGDFNSSNRTDATDCAPSHEENLQKYTSVAENCTHHKCIADGNMTALVMHALPASCWRSSRSLRWFRTPSTSSSWQGLVDRDVDATTSAQHCCHCSALHQAQPQYPQSWIL